MWEYAALVTSLDAELVTLGQLYRDRGDCENAFDELKNQWGWGGFTTHDLKRCRLLAGSVALIFNWWSLFVRRLTRSPARGDHQPSIADAGDRTADPACPAGNADHQPHAPPTTTGTAARPT